MSNIKVTLDTRKIEQEIKKAAEKQMQEAKRQAEKEARNAIAKSIVEKQPIIEGVKMLDENSEEILKFLLTKRDKQESFFLYKEVPEGYEDGIIQILDTLQQYGKIFEYEGAIGGYFRVSLSPSALKYFENKKNALKQQQEKQSLQNVSINNLNATGSSFNFGTMSNSTLNSQNVISDLEKEIEKNGGEEKEELKDLLEQVKELCENIKTSEQLPKSKTLMNKLSNHLEKHGWFYGAVVNLIGTAVMEIMRQI